MACVRGASHHDLRACPGPHQGDRTLDSTSSGGDGKAEKEGLRERSDDSRVLQTKLKAACLSWSVSPSPGAL